jgi:hypothetical protein
MGNKAGNERKYKLTSPCEEGDLKTFTEDEEYEDDEDDEDYADEKSSLEGFNKKELENALFLACQKGYLELVRYLIEDKGVDLHAEGGRALSEACKTAENVKVIKFLLKKGIDTDENASEALRKALEATSDGHTLYHLVHDEKSRLMTIYYTVAQRGYSPHFIALVAGKKF